MTDKLFGRMATWQVGRGFGFIVRDDGQPDVFAHISDIEGKIEPVCGERVSFSVAPSRRSPGKLQALDITLIDDGSA